MFGEKLDYWILRFIAHSDNLATDNDLRDRELQHKLDLEKSKEELNRHLDRFNQQFMIDPNLSYLDIGCGFGDFDYALIDMGVRNLTAVDIVESKIKVAENQRGIFQNKKQPKFLASDIINWEPLGKFNIIFSINSIEHISQPAKLLHKIYQILEDNGRVFLGFCPLFHSPFGDHQWECYRVQIPWRGLVFNKKALMQVRREFYRPDDHAERFEDVWLNCMRYSQFLQYCREAGFMINFLNINPQLKAFLPVYFFSTILTSIPKFGDYFTASVYIILSKDK